MPLQREQVPHEQPLPSLRRDRIIQVCTMGTTVAAVPDMRECFKKYTKMLSEAIALVNARMYLLIFMNVHTWFLAKRAGRQSSTSSQRGARSSVRAPFESW